MKYVPAIARVLMGAVFTFGGIAFFFTTPPPLEGPMAAFFSGMMATGYFFYLLKGTEIVCGLMLLSGFFVPLALVVLAPIILNIFLVHAFLEPSGVVLAVILGVLEIYLAFFSAPYSPKIKALFCAR
ncbi:MAG: DoxX family membrane protein [Bdellovibrionia bacterium]